MEEMMKERRTSSHTKKTNKTRELKRATYTATFGCGQSGRVVVLDTWCRIDSGATPSVFDRIHRAKIRENTHREACHCITCLLASNRTPRKPKTPHKQKLCVPELCFFSNLNVCSNPTDHTLLNMAEPMRNGRIYGTQQEHLTLFHPFNQRFPVRIKIHPTV
jgi:hypothetical protein